MKRKSAFWLSASLLIMVLFLSIQCFALTAQKNGSDPSFQSTKGPANFIVVGKNFTKDYVLFLNGHLASPELVYSEN
jgi:NADH:ubiquinone oxidoreductase subunit 6 (subunit J)